MLLSACCNASTAVCGEGNGGDTYRAFSNANEEGLDFVRTPLASKLHNGLASLQTWRYVESGCCRCQDGNRSQMSGIDEVQTDEVLPKFKVSYSSRFEEEAALGT